MHHRKLSIQEEVGKYGFLVQAGLYFIITIRRLKFVKMITILFRLSVPTDDSWGLGCTIWEVFNGPLGAANELGR